MGVRRRRAAGRRRRRRARRAGRAIADACADERWGAPIGDVDLDDPRADDRVALPAGARPGDVLVASFDPGCRVIVEVIEREGTIGSVLGDLRYDDTADARVGVGAGDRHRADPAAGRDRGRGERPVRGAAGRARRACACAPGPASTSPIRDVLGGPWRTRGDLWEARFRLGLPYERTGEWWPFEIVARAAVDGDDEQLGYALARLDMF